MSFALEETPRIICNCKLVPGHYREYQKNTNMGLTKGVHLTLRNLLLKYILLVLIPVSSAAYS